jgi:ribosomal protein S12 methylthiotransferase accessory factor
MDDVLDAGANSVSAAEKIAAAYGMEIDSFDSMLPGDTLARHRAIARINANGVTFAGYGAGPSPAAARAIAIMECAEREVQFSQPTRRTVLASGLSLGRRAVSPEVFGLYSPAQYRTPGFGPRPFHDTDTHGWIEVEDLASGRDLLVATEFLFPAKPEEARIVHETSSGTAAHLGVETATIGAVCEVIERDSLLTFWHRQPVTPLVPPARVPEPGQKTLRAVVAAGWATFLADLTYDQPVPVFMAFALRGRRFRYGLGCDLDAGLAAARAARELAAAVGSGPSVVRLFPITATRTPQDHQALYDGGILHGYLRTTLARTLRSNQPAAGPQSGCQSLVDLVQALNASNRPVLRCDLTPPAVATLGVKVVRVLIPGSIPLYFGHDRLRLSCQRLIGPSAPGRLTNLLPHFIG